jgi:hypothetical protein
MINAERKYFKHSYCCMLCGKRQKYSCNPNEDLICKICSSKYEFDEERGEYYEKKSCD